MSLLLEICANSLSSALAAEKGGAQRIELCTNLAIGGTTPSAATIQLACQKLSLPVYVLIRPREGDFCYTPEELAVIEQDILFAKTAGAKGVVIGALQADGRIDQAAMKQLMEVARPMSVTFHRAFDVCPKPLETLETLIELGVDRLLTSGQQATAWKGRYLIRDLVRAAQNRLMIMVGAGVNAQNIQALAEFTGATEFHASAKQLRISPMEYQSNAVYFGGHISLPEHDYYTSDVVKIEALRTALYSNSNS